MYVGELELQSNPETAFRQSLTWTPPPLREEWERIIQQMEKGSTLEEGMARLAQQANSPILTRVSSVIIHLCREGTSHSSLQSIQRVAEDLRMQERNTLRAFAQKLTVFTLLFIACSALIPAFFLSFVSIGSTFLETTWKPEEILVITLVVFPLIDLFILGWVWIQTPIIQSPVQEQKEPWIAHIDFICKQNGLAGGWKKLLRSSIIEGCALFLIGWSIFLAFRLEGIEPVLILITGTIFPFLVNVAVQEKTFKETTKKIEQQVLDSLLFWSALPNTWAFERKMEEVGKNAPFPMQTEWNGILQRIQKGESVPHALEKLGEKRESPLLERVKRLLIQGYVSGASLGESCTRLASDGMQQQALMDERQSSLLIEKYTLLGAGGIIVPVLLGLSMGMVGHLSLGISGKLTNPELQNVIVWGTRGYLFLYAIIASAFVGWMENSWGRARVYMIWLVPLSQLVWWVGQLLTG